MVLPSTIVGNERFFVTADEHFNNKMIIEIIGKNFAKEYSAVLPGEHVEGGVYPATGFAGTNNQKSKVVLGLRYRALEDCVIDTVRALHGAIA
jgi:hypothetical protein